MKTIKNNSPGDGEGTHDFLDLYSNDFCGSDVSIWEIFRYLCNYHLDKFIPNKHFLFRRLFHGLLGEILFSNVN